MDLTADVVAPEPGSPEPDGEAVAPTPRRSRAGCLPLLLIALLAVAGLALDAVGGHDAVHRVVAKVVPAVRHPLLAGPLDLTGQVVTQPIRATQTTSLLQVGGTCVEEDERSSWYFTARLPDGSRFDLRIGLPRGHGGPGVYERPKVSVAADAKKGRRFTSWASASDGPVALVVRHDGSGDLEFADLPAGQAGGTNLSGHLAWTCTMT